MMAMILMGPLVLGSVFLFALLLEGYLYQSGGTMNERKAVVFEIYRYAVCFIMIILFAFMAFQLFSGLVADMSNPAALAGPGVGTLLTALIFFAHWMLKNPACDGKGQDASGNA